MHREKSFLFPVIVLTLLLAAGCSKEQRVEEIQLPEEKKEVEKESENEVRKAEEEDADSSGEIFVHVCGEVKNPGVYQLSAGSRIYEAVELAGGLSGQADPSAINQAAQAEDGQQIYIPSVEESAAATSSGGSPGETEDGRINLNTAGKEELMTLSGIGEAKASAIISYRQEHGGFKSIEELMEVEGIKEGVFQKVKDQIKV